MALYFYFNPSYQKSLQAKYYYEMGDYDEAYADAKEAFELDLYNRMAATIMAQSKTSLKYVNYIKDAKEYMKQIDEIVSKDDIKEADKAKIRLICEIMNSAYVKLAPSVITDKELVENAAYYHAGFEQLLEKVNR
ncbi:hypothetical protein FJR48_12110 (plasmid) [Sulfurimonas lithotrophica]|uniref:Tetratricopeptide repeat protein n=2 Tax=Sulfurimonas lithotrophica TaxID=2590022 RepID=A0A5P8P458_9BACT|nr:hypothetical protein FJR48_09580 [Sulfurimonas lithotrophica]QFR50541.1 hypothetical protein FJR48_11910 [Sulfurimonas lithotrophica]QFR50543.1 hypothetical protein FJR48_12110 [Sulfurimonas lithotrophica]